jgi:hypothetical protein
MGVKVLEMSFDALEIGFEALKRGFGGITNIFFSSYLV